MSGFQIFAADAAFQNHAARNFFTHPTKGNALSFPDFCQKAWTARLELTKALDAEKNWKGFQFGLEGNLRIVAGYNLENSN